MVSRRGLLTSTSALALTCSMTFLVAPARGQIINAMTPTDVVTAINDANAGGSVNLDVASGVAIDLSGTTLPTYGATTGSLTIGQGLPVALGASLAAPHLRTVAIQSDGSAQYTVQSLWTMARESLPVTVVIAANNRYGVLQNELHRDGLTDLRGASAELTALDRPAIDWTALARGYGVPATYVTTTAALRHALDASLASAGPALIAMELP